jgi:hypothetical protein
MKPPVELLPVALDRCHASTRMDGPDPVGISRLNAHDLENSDFPMVDIPMPVGTSLLAPEAYLPRSFCRSDGYRDPAPNLTASDPLSDKDCKLRSKFILDSMVTIEP